VREFETQLYGEDTNISRELPLVREQFGFRRTVCGCELCRAIRIKALIERLDFNSVLQMRRWEKSRLVGAHDLMLISSRPTVLYIMTERRLYAISSK
jgi:hypothetical protein